MHERVVPYVRERMHEESLADLVPKHLPPLYRNFYNAVLLGEPMAPTNDDIRHAAGAHFDVIPMTPISYTETRALRRDMEEEYRIGVNRSVWKALTGPVYLAPALETSPFRRKGLRWKDQLVGGDEGKIWYLRGEEPLTAAQKEALLTDVNFYDNAEYYDGGYGGTGSLHGFGTRPLVTPRVSGSSYGYTEEGFSSLLSFTRDAQGKRDTDELRGLDIGGSTGLAARDAELRDPQLSMTNLFTRAEMAFYPLRGGHLLQQAEYMPDSMREQFDVIISHMTFMYMRYPDIALMNSIHALRTGGVLDISFRFSRCPLDLEGNGEELAKRLDALYPNIVGLQEAGKIQVLPTFTEYPGNSIEKWQQTGEVKAGRVCIQKKASID